MLISTYTGDKEIRIQTISLRKNYDNPTLTYGFYCIFCGDALCKIQGEVVKITPGLAPTTQAVVITKCLNCKKEFNFQTITDKPRITRITLTNYSDNVSTFHCYICRTPLVQHKDSYAVSLPTFAAMRLPYPLKCIRPTCPANMQIVDIV